MGVNQAIIAYWWFKRPLFLVEIWLDLFPNLEKILLCDKKGNFSSIQFSSEKEKKVNSKLRLTQNKYGQRYFGEVFECRISSEYLWILPDLHGKGAVGNLEMSVNS